MTYPNLLVLSYLQSTKQSNPEVQMTAERYVAIGYQRLLTFEVSGGGFSLFGEPPAVTFLSAYGLLQLHDMAQVYPVDEAVIDRTAQWLLRQQASDGTWSTGDYRAGGGKVGPTGYITWALVEAGYGDTPEVTEAIGYLRRFAAEEKDAYSLALAANALAAYDRQDPSTQAAIEQLYALRTEKNDTVYWSIGGASFMGATGSSGNIETTALAVLALLRAGVHSEAINGALAYLVQAKDSWGTWGTTQATILSLKALLAANSQGGKATGPITVRVSLNGEQTQEITIDESNGDVVHQVLFDRGFLAAGGDQVRIEVEGESNLMYQVTTAYYLPWDRAPAADEAQEVIHIDQVYDRTQLAVNDTLTVDVTVQLNQPGTVKMALVDLGVPPGFNVLTEDLDRWVAQKVISRYELTGRQIILYLENLTPENPVRISYRLQARFPLRAQVPASSAYDYYNPEKATVEGPGEVEVVR